MPHKYLVTGGGGFIGSHLVDALLRPGDAVTVLDNFSTGRRENLYAVAEDIELVEGDLRSYERVHHAMRGVDFVVHLGALPSVPRSVQDPLTTNEVNITGTVNVLLAARDAGVKRVIFASSSSVYGANASLPKREGSVPMPISPYGVSKLAAEQYCMAFTSVYSLEAVGLRFFNVFGPRQDPRSEYSAVIPRFLRLALEEGEAVVYGDGGQTRDFTYVANVVAAIKLAMHQDGAAGHVCNVGCGESHSVTQLVEAVETTTGRPLRVRHEPSRLGDVRDSYASIDEARRILGYEPSIELLEGLRLTLESLS